VSAHGWWLFMWCSDRVTAWELRPAPCTRTDNIKFLAVEYRARARRITLCINFWNNGKFRNIEHHMCHFWDYLGYQASLGAPDTSVEFQRVNSQICVAMMVFAQIYVAEMISSYLWDPENKTGAFGWVKSWKRQITKNTTRKPKKWQWRPLANEERIKLSH